MAGVMDVALGLARIAIGIEFSPRSIRVASSAGHRVEISGAFDDPDTWLDHVFYGLAAPPGSSLLGVLALPLRLARGDVSQLEFQLRERLTAARLCSTPAAVARGVGLTGPRPAEAGLVVHVIAEESSIELYRRGSLVGADVVRPIAGREAREVAVAARCLLKTLAPEDQRRAAARMTVAGHAAALDGLGRERLARELEALGGRPAIRDEPQLVAAGAMALAENLRA